MLDGVARRWVDPLLEAGAARLVGMGVGANAVTLAGFAIGCAAAVAISVGIYAAGLVLLLASRLCDGLDGAVARRTAKTDFGGFLDITLDFAFYGMIPFAFAWADPNTNAIPAAFLVLSFYVNGASFLAFASIAARRNLDTDVRGAKSLYFTTGLAEATETMAAFALACLFPAWFPQIAVAFALMCFVTAAARIMLAARTFR